MPAQDILPRELRQCDANSFRRQRCQADRHLDLRFQLFSTASKCVQIRIRRQTPRMDEPQCDNPAESFLHAEVRLDPTSPGQRTNGHKHAPVADVACSVLAGLRMRTQNGSRNGHYSPPFSGFKQECWSSLIMSLCNERGPSCQ